MVLLATGQSLFNPANQGFVMACAQKDQLSTVGALLVMCRSIALPLGIVCCTALLSALSAAPAQSNVNVSHVTRDGASPLPSSTAVVAIDTAAARVTVWLYLLPTAAATVVTLMRGEPRKTSCISTSSERADAAPAQTMDEMSK